MTYDTLFFITGFDLIYMKVFYGETRYIIVIIMDRDKQQDTGNG